MIFSNLFIFYLYEIDFSGNDDRIVLGTSPLGVVSCSVLFQPFQPFCTSDLGLFP